jgi:hypothetical protein
VCLAEKSEEDKEDEIRTFTRAAGNISVCNREEEEKKKRRGRKRKEEEVEGRKEEEVKTNKQRRTGIHKKKFTTNAARSTAHGIAHTYQTWWFPLCR